MTCETTTAGTLCHSCGTYSIGFHSCGITPGYSVSAVGERGWLCPACGRGNAPWKGTCPCSGKKP